VNEIDGLLRAYRDFVRQPWERNLAGPRRVWFVVYEPRQERRLRRRLPEFELETRAAHHAWTSFDLTDTFGRWIGANEYADAYFASDDFADIQPALRDYEESLQSELRQVLTTAEGGEDGVVAMYGLGALFGLTSAAALIEAVASTIQGRLLVLFPGQYEGSNYRLLDARDGWNYLAVPITTQTPGYPA
jgi:hypothetical protein